MIWIPLAVLTGLAVAGMVRYLDYLDAIWEARRWWEGETVGSTVPVSKFEYIRKVPYER